MQRPPRPVISRTSTLPKPTEYVLALDNEYKDFAFSEERAPSNKGQWRKLMAWKEERPLDVEVGTGNGLFFSHYAIQNPDRALVGLELKYKPLIQTIRRARKAGCTNVAVTRFHAFNLDQIFEKNEINNVFIHFPDPWTSPLKPKNRLTNSWFLNMIYDLQRPGSYLNFKTDSFDLFEWSLEEIRNTNYKVEFQTFDLHNSEWALQNFVTGFERIFTQQGIKTNFIRLAKT